MAALAGVFAKQGLGVDELTKMFAKVEADVFAAATGTRELAKVYTTLGFSVQQLAAMSPDERFVAIARAALESANATGALAEVFGQKLGPKARLALEDIADGYRKVNQATGEMLDKIDAAADEWASWGHEFKVGFLAPVISGLHEAMNIWTDFNAALATSVMDGKFNPADWARKAGEMAGARAAANDIRRARAQEARNRERLDLTRTARTTVAGDTAAAAQETRSKEVDAFIASMEPAMREMKEEADRERKRTALEVAYAADKREGSARYKERLRSIEESTRGRGVDADVFARVGGFAGGNRAGLAAIDRQVQVQRESKRAVEENTVAMKELTERFNFALGQLGGTGGSAD